MPYPMIAIGKLFTREELLRGQKIYDQRGGSNQALKDKLRDEIVVPAMDRINAATGQENDPDYMAYALIFVYQSLERGS